MQVSDESLGAFLLESGAVPRRTLDEAWGMAEGRGSALAEQLVVGGYLSRDEVRRAQAHLLGVPFVELSHDSLQEDALFLIPEPLARRRSLVAFRRNSGEVEVALLDLGDLEHLDFLHTEHGLRILPRLTTNESIKRALIYYQKKLKEQFGALAKGGATAAEALLRHALLSRASNVHLDFKTAGLLVHYRVNGLLHEAMTLPKEAVALFARLKTMANLSPTLHVPQEGAFKIEMKHGEEVRVRVHALPAHQGERLVLHLTPTTSTRKGFILESLGLHGEPLDAAYKLLNLKSGLVLVAGPQGSGGTTLLYTLLDTLYASHKHVVTVEEDIELVLPHATQLRVRPEVGLNTAATLRAALRQDPDVVMVSRVHDRETAELVVTTAARGILVLAGVETAGTEEAAENLVALGARRSELERVLRGVVATKVVGRVCPNCKEAYKLSRAEGAAFEGKANPDAKVGVNFGRVLAALKEEGVVHPDTQWKEVQFARAGAGCGECQRGYTGLVGLQEVRAYGETPLTLVEDGLFKAAQGLTSIEEVFRIAGGES